MTRMRSGVASTKTRERRASALWGLPLLLLLTLACLANGCVTDVSQPFCVLYGTPCQAAGEGGGTGTEEGSDVANGGIPAAGGDVVNHGGQAHGAAAGGDKTDPSAGVGGQGGDPPSPSADLAVDEQELVRACATRSYQATLHVVGGVGPYEWQLTPAVPGWSISSDPQHSERGLLSSEAVASGNTTLGITITDARGNSKRVERTLHARNHCWFAYTALDAGEPTLQLLDPLADPPAPQLLDHNSGVYDFQFSPDGRYLAYRFGADPGHPHGTHLALVELGTLHEQLVDFAEDSIISFAWSPDSTLLAAGFQVGDTAYLGALRMPAAGSDNPPAALVPTAAFIDSDIYWVRNDFIAFHTELLPDLAPGHEGEFLDNDEHKHTSYYARLGVTGFATPERADGTFTPDVVLRPTAEGFFMITAPAPQTYFTWLGDMPQTVSHSDIRLVSPSGRYSASLDADLLQINPAASGVYFPVAFADEADTCPKLLAWAPGVERLACVADVANGSGDKTHGEVRFFELAADESSLSMVKLGGACDEDTSMVAPASCTARINGYAYGTDQASGAARAFSASGRWFAFTRVVGTATYLYWADLNPNPPQLTRAARITGNDPSTLTRLAFAPDERLFAFQRGPALMIQNPAEPVAPWPLPGELTVDQPCSEDFPKTPTAYCGNTELSAPLQWSPDSQALAFRTPGQLVVSDLVSFPARVQSFSLPATECGTSCTGQFAFQPEPGN